MLRFHARRWWVDQVKLSPTAVWREFWESVAGFFEAVRDLSSFIALPLLYPVVCVLVALKAMRYRRTWAKLPPEKQAKAAESRTWGAYISDDE